MENRKKSVKKIIILVVSIAVTILAVLIVCRILMVRAYRAHVDQAIWEIEYSEYVQAMGGTVTQEVGEEGIDDLIAYSSFINNEGVSVGMDKMYNSCRICCCEILLYNEIDPDRATPEQITDAFNKAIIVENYSVERYGYYRFSEELIDEALAAYEEEQNGE